MLQAKTILLKLAAKNDGQILDWGLKVILSQIKQLLREDKTNRFWAKARADKEEEIVFSLLHFIHQSTVSK